MQVTDPAPLKFHTLDGSPVAVSVTRAGLHVSVSGPIRPNHWTAEPADALALADKIRKELGEK